jgi:hypothetical protein
MQDEDKPAVRFETVVEPEEVENQVPEEKVVEVVNEQPEKSNDSQRLEELSRALQNGGIEAEEEPSYRKSSGGNWGWLAFVLIFIFGSGLGMAGGYMMWGKQFKVDDSQQSQEQSASLSTQDIPAVAPTSIPTPTVVAPTLSRKQIHLQVLNGSGVKGAASVVKDYLEGLGYPTIDTGNATKDTYLETTVSVKTAKKAFVSTLVADLAKEKQVASQAGTLAEDSKYDAVIILGSK